MRFVQLPLIVLLVFCAALVPSRPLANSVCCQVWHNVPGAQITDTLTTTALQRPPDQSLMIGQMEYAPHCADGSVVMLTALVQAPIRGAYWFHIASTDSGLLYLSSDESAANLKEVAETPAATRIHDFRYYSAQTSDGVLLQAGHRYLLQAIAKCGGESGCLSVAWTMAGARREWPILNQRFCPVDHVPPPPSLRLKEFSLTLKPSPPTTQPGFYPMVRGAQMDVDGRPVDMSYLLYVPRKHIDSAEPTPMLVFLHGNSMQGYDLQRVRDLGPNRFVAQNPMLRDWFPMLVLTPQLPPDWRWDTPGAAQAVNALVQRLCERDSRIDRRRIYLTGYSMGGKGTWLTLENSPQTYAAAIPISAVDVRPDAAGDLLKDLPGLHIACGSEDGGFTAGSHRMFDALKPVLGDRLQFTVFQHEGHGVWDHFYTNKSFYQDLLNYSNSRTYENGR